MKHSIAIKFLAVMLCALSVVSILACGFGILFLEDYNLYNEPLETQRQEQLETIAQELAWYHAELYAAETLSNCPNEIFSDILHPPYVTNWMGSQFAVLIYENGEVVSSINSQDRLTDHYTQRFSISPNYPIVTYQYTLKENDMPVAMDVPTEDPTNNTPMEILDATYPPDMESLPSEVPAPAAESSEPAAGWTAQRDTALAKVEGQEILYSSEHSEEFYDQNGRPYQVIYTLNYYQGPSYEVDVFVAEKAALGTEFALMSLLYPYRSAFIPLLLISLLVFAATLVYLFASAGVTKTGEICPAALNRVPLDVYLFVSTAGICLVALLLVELMDNYSGGYYGIWNNLPLCILVLGLGSFAIALMVIGPLFALSAQVKTKGFWWRHSICGRLIDQLDRFFRWVRRGLRYFYRGCRAVVRLLPVIWQWLLIAFAMVLVPLVFLLFAMASYSYAQLFWIFLFLLACAADVAMVCYGGWCFGMLLRGAKAMSEGNLNRKINTKYLFGAFKDFSNQLNRLAEGAKIAAVREMKSERMRTELITNVSHDIKTPLTSIINYVDLLKKPHSDKDGAQYLEVLDRQSQRLKKLVDDLMEMSKASTGNMTVELTHLDAVEAVNQALGEFADKLDSVNLTPVFRHPDTPVTMLADGRLVWRVLSNVLSNAVKYAMPDTRLYVDLMVLQGNAVIAIKNISRDQLNVNADELMERFVRGDSSRNTEGSGLGLNIAKSLVELQHGQMHLMVDGDLFKVTLIFPCV